jgi:YHS domain-containing protein
MANTPTAITLRAQPNRNMQKKAVEAIFFFTDRYCHRPELSKTGASLLSIVNSFSGTVCYHTLKEATAMLHRIARFVLALVLTSYACGAAAGSVISGADKGPAIGGYDAVAYFTDGKPTKGSADYTAEWQGASWQFASAEHRDLFIDAPEKYAPQYGGYCAYAAAHGSIAKGSGERWRIVDDKLYLNNNWIAQKLWQGDVPGNIKNSDEKWPSVKSKIEAKN